jgi:asparagine synthase (glutamine-hydrolysing)
MVEGASFWPARVSPGAHSLLNRMRFMDLGLYLPDDILVKVDRATMSVGLESRAPFLDHSVVELAWALPEHALVRRGETKWILRRVLDRYLDRKLFERPKQGFGIPLARWLRRELRPWAERLLDPAALAAHGLIAVAPVRRLWAQHAAGSHDRSAHLWNVLMLQAWLEQRAHSTEAPRRPVESVA